MKRMNPKARRYLLTFASEPFAWSFGHTGGRWGLQEIGEFHPNAVPRVYHFASPAERAAWIRASPQRRKAIGKRHPLVKEFRARLEQEERHERAMTKAREAEYTTWMWETP